MINYCPYCGTKIIEGAKYCEGCGKKIIQLNEIIEKKVNEINNDSNINPENKEAGTDLNDNINSEEIKEPIGINDYLAIILIFAIFILILIVTRTYY